MIKYSRIFSPLLIIIPFVLMMFGCAISTETPIQPGDGSLTGDIIGYAYFINNEDNSGITITAEKVAGITTASVKKSIIDRRLSPKAIAAQTTTDAYGYFELNGLEVGMYTIYASSMDSLEKAITTNVEVIAGEKSIADDLNLTPTGSISGKATLDGAGSGNLGIIVFIAGTSYMAMTDDAGDYTINYVPSGTDYTLVASMEGYDDASTGVSVTAWQITTADTLDLVSSNGAPIALPGTLFIPAGVESWEIGLLAYDPDNDPLTYHIDDNPDNGSLSQIDGPLWEYIPGPDHPGTDSFTFYVNDGIANSNTVMVIVWIISL